MRNLVCKTEGVKKKNMSEKCLRFENFEKFHKFFANIQTIILSTNNAMYFIFHLTNKLH